MVITPSKLRRITLRGVYKNECHCDVCEGKRKVAPLTGVAGLAQGVEQKYLEPTKLLRKDRYADRQKNENK